MENSNCEKSNQMIATQYALRVALQTMKERCLCQQNRLAEMEEENQCLRQRLATSQQTNKTIHNNVNEITENYQLRLQISELQLQKKQLDTHINMVSNENRKLWSRLSQITKGHPKTHAKNTSPLYNELGSNENPLGLTVHQNLIRSKTFTQHSPNPNLRHKLMATSNENVDYLDIDDGTVDDLDFLRSRVEGKSDFGMVDTDFGYFNADDLEDNADNYGFSAEAKKCIEGFHDMRREAIKQQQDLDFLVTFLKNRSCKYFQ